MPQHPPTTDDEAISAAHLGQFTPDFQSEIWRIYRVHRDGGLSPVVAWCRTIAALNEAFERQEMEESHAE